MSSDIVIRAEGLGKQYRLGEMAPYYTLREAIQAWASVPLKYLRGHGERRRADKNGHIWALRDLSFEVRQGDVLGIIGRNGAGKSTLLKILSRITKPSTGRAEIHGRVGSLLEVGTGFHPELTGRENVFLNGAILGMCRKEIKRKLAEIVDFSGVERFLDTPVKRYSSGMRVRLAFAVAAHLQPEILLVDEVLAVGDAKFRAKCLDKMGSVATEGRTVLLVSHDMQAIATLAETCLLLSEGRSAFQGPANDAINRYFNELGNCDETYAASPDPSKPKVTYVALETSAPGNRQDSGEPMEVHLKIATPAAIDGACVSLQFMNHLGEPIVHVWNFDSERPFGREQGIYELQCRIPKLRLNIGQYSLTVNFAERPGGRHFERIERVCPFEVVNHRQRDYPWRASECAYLEDMEWQIEKLPMSAT